MDDGLLQSFQSRLETIKMTVPEFDEFCSSQDYIVRSIRGHAFEVWFDELMSRSGYNCRIVGGDEVVDRVLNGHTIQLKTPYLRGTIEKQQISFRMHRTHGREKHPEALYLPAEFADFLVGLHPDGGLVICPATELTRRAALNPNLKWGEYIADPLPFEWNTPWLNRFDLLGVAKDRLVFLTTTTGTVLPKLSEAVGFGDAEIIKAIMSKENFRVWNQLIVGSVRQHHFMKFITRNNIDLKEPTELDTRGREKVDYVYWQKSKGKLLRIQVKGLTRGLCKGNTLGCETQCSHSRVPVRLYRRSDFEVLVIVIDPGVIPADTAEKLGVGRDEYNYLFVRMSDLPLHPKSTEWGDEFIRPVFRFDVREQNLNNVDLLASY